MSFVLALEWTERRGLRHIWHEQGVRLSRMRLVNMIWEEGNRKAGWKRIQMILTR